ncbi:MAG: 2-oxo-4-hydroxy-4-carboxy-5-ureidoimidazoline decarboxylase [Gemmatimonadaceae bacterium]
MTVTLGELNSMTRDEAAELLRSCCGATSWVNAMLDRRPYESVTRLLDDADVAWATTTVDDWHEAFSHHPRIGEKATNGKQTGLAGGWSEAEQKKIRVASSSAHDQMSLVNIAYEQKFGHIYIVNARGKSANDLLDIARSRLKNNPEKELRIAAGEVREITRLRLEKLLGIVPE